jgi:hypothetical protein
MSCPQRYRNLYQRNGYAFMLGICPFQVTWKGHIPNINDIDDQVCQLN